MMQLDPETIKAIQQIATEAAEAVYAKEGSQYGVARVPAHTHNGVDSNNIVPTSVTGFLPLPATLDGVVNPIVLQNQIVTQGNTSRGYGRFESVGQSSFPIFPMPIIYGNGAGTDSEFQGGEAPEGTLIFFNNGPTISGLWIRSGGNWFGIGQASTGYRSIIV